MLAGSRGYGTTDHLRTKAVPGAAVDPRPRHCPPGPTKSAKPGVFRSRASSGDGCRPRPPASGGSTDRSLVKSDRLTPVASIRHSSALNCSSFCCATRTAADSAPAVQTARVDRTISRATPVLMVITTVAAVSASTSNEPQSSANEARSRTRRHCAVIPPLACKAAAFGELARITGKSGEFQRVSYRRIAETGTPARRRNRRICDLSRRSAPARRRTPRSAFRQRQGEREARAAFVLDGSHAPVVGHDDLLNEWQSQPGAPGLGGEERAEHPFRDRW